jgi:hypothetical protein
VGLGIEGDVIHHHAGALHFPGEEGAQGVVADVGHDGGVAAEAGDVDRDIGRRAALMAVEGARGRQRVGGLGRDEVDQELADRQQVVGVAVIPARRRWVHVSLHFSFCC